MIHVELWRMIQAWIDYKLTYLRVYLRIFHLWWRCTSFIRKPETWTHISILMPDLHSRLCRHTCEPHGS